MRLTHTLFVLGLMGLILGLVSPATTLAYQAQGETPGPGRQDDRDATYPPAGQQPDTTRSDGIGDITDSRAEAGTSWIATIIAFFAGLGLGWLVFRRPNTRRADTDYRRAA
jgi:hypothetical protein